MKNYIERDEALSFPYANGKYDHKNANEHFIFGCESYREWLENLPTADVRENVHGKWIKLDMYKGMEQYKCSACGQSCYVPECMGEPMYLFCPDCGALMQEDEP